MLLAMYILSLENKSSVFMEVVGIIEVSNVTKYANISNAFRRRRHRGSSSKRSRVMTVILETIRINIGNMF